MNFLLILFEVSLELLTVAVPQRRGPGWAESSLKAIWLRRAMHDKGYRWLTYRQARQLHAELGDSSAAKLPDWEEVRVIPGASESIDFLINLVLDREGY